MNELVTINQEALQIVPTKTDVANAAQSLTAIVEEGYVNPLQALAAISAYEQVFATAKKAIQDFAINEAMKYPDKTINAYGAQFQLKETGVKYDYSQDQDWNDINANIEEMKALLKGRETTLRQLGLCSKSSTTTVSVTLAK